MAVPVRVKDRKLSELAAKLFDGPVRYILQKDTESENDHGAETESELDD
jgi:hypothetical protein